MRLSLLAIAVLSTSLLPAQTGRWRTLDGSPPLVIGHRGASGYYPEHTLAGYRRAIELGADFIEPDLVSTKDGVLIARHEPILDGTTDVASRAEFASKKTTKTLDGIKTTAFFAGDFTLAEIKRLRAIQPNAARSKQFDFQFEVPTFEEIVQMVQSESAARSRTIGIYPETKHPTFHFVSGLPLEDRLLAILEKYNLTFRNSPVIIQSFEVANLKYLRTRTAVRLVQLIDADDVGPDGKLTYAAPYDKPYDFAVVGDARGFGDLVTDAQLTEIATYADGIGPWKRYIVSVNAAGQLIVSDLVARAHKAGLLVHAYTFRNEPNQVAAAYNGDPKAEYTQFFVLGVDGVFTDFTDTAFAARQSAAALVP
ncbi:MAG: glycerophosphodiester phosphodiesterase [Bryobacteraceae bacterium]|nr:glycerophosphodiester phosphodiesterase [Bryobacteraceae bacterium]